MFIPIHDANHLRHIRLQYVTLAIIALNIGVWLTTSMGGMQFTQLAAISLGYIPSVANELAMLPPELELVPWPLTYFTYAFIHGDILHLGGNMLFLWVFGDNVEDAVGHFRFLVFYLACAAAGAAFHGITLPDSQSPLIGASGAVAGLISAYLILHPRVKLWVLAFARIPLRMPAYIALALWISTQFVMFLAFPEDQVSWAAHIGGIVAGAVLVVFLRRPGVPLFDRNLVTPKAARLD
ncbi:rhomboid family intramembrane serine protease [Chelativorans sp. Marseille-P2723]|uniref:rhomboid family intramembrane serine protease n=1 Tax=Chelativorans sp. Marseille-P2723 TaxID=2709133 RepID=UPI00156E23AA|nr:rhomboid family intramembrane serine protease [Chelativorans sp. Marseille-P2723]